jgi:hypothetical protein
LKYPPALGIKCCDEKVLILYSKFLLWVEIGDLLGLDCFKIINKKS